MSIRFTSTLKYTISSSLHSWVYNIGTVFAITEDFNGWLDSSVTVSHVSLIDQSSYKSSIKLSYHECPSGC